jgi:hypothetical protein|tara:strand:+ start:154 stop:309 length:156 start_codon:yes stop_codon:yes gene_type:complete
MKEREREKENTFEERKECARELFLSFSVFYSKRSFPASKTHEDTLFSSPSS